MSCIGSDIISLKDRTNCKSFTNYNYIQKILTSEELQVCHKHVNSQYLPFLFWTCKESAYKIDIKSGVDIGFVPQYYEVKIENVLNTENIIYVNGTVRKAEKVYYFKSKIYPEYISTVACLSRNKLSAVKGHIGESNDQSVKARECLKIYLSDYYNIDVDKFEIGKTEKGIPYILCADSIPMPDISFSHDGDYYSYALLV